MDKDQISIKWYTNGLRFVEVGLYKGGIELHFEFAKAISNYLACSLVWLIHICINLSDAMNLD